MSGFDDVLLDYYQRELHALRHLGAEFARAHPKVAARLDLGGQASADPQVERLLESFAFLTGRIQRSLDADFPLIPAALLEVLYPHLVAPVPSMAIARWQLGQGEMAADQKAVVQRGARLYADTEDGVTCRFRTCYAVTLRPLRVAGADVLAPDDHEATRGRPAAGVVRLTLESASPKQTLADLAVDSLRLHLGGTMASASHLHEMLTTRLRDVIVVPGDGGAPVSLGAACVRPVGFADAEAVLPDPPQAHPAYRLVQEYFAFPEKFLFVDVDGLDRALAGTRAEILFLLDRPLPRAVSVSEESFRLFCTPVINLFPKTTEPLRLDHRRSEYLLVPDARWEPITEIHSLLKVSAYTDPRESADVVAPFFSAAHTDGTEERAFYVARRAASRRAAVPGTDLFVRFVDLDFNPEKPAAKTLYAHTLCTNRGLAEEIPAGTRLNQEDAAPVRLVALDNRPTPQRPPPLEGQVLWRLVSHLSLNHLSLDGGPRSLAALKEILFLYGDAGRPDLRRQIEGLRGLDVKPIVRRLRGGGWNAFVPGRAITLSFDRRDYAGGSPTLLGFVLERFFALYAGMDAFTQLTMLNTQNEGDSHTWPPATGVHDAL
ncbi:type VI secretion system baseplate subunit TssF [Novispirillum sp. DQ9]|uniref:type VI secretion system baseplate subunit TssF n=1 Tax=Novispirillum sp. DQ9 TaxID=3398612 RepID=UPI003C7B092D